MRKIKLMALLLAALMVMSAFAGCASGVKDDVADLNDRIGAIEDKLNGLGDNKDVLDAIESMGKDLNDKIDDLNDRVDAVETPEEGATTPAAVKAAIETALISINVKSAEFAKNIDEYSEADYLKIVEALGAAKAAVNTAATEADVATAMNTLEATLKNYMTYAMRMYDYYTKLLGNLADLADEDTKALVEEVRDYIKAVEKVGITAADLVYVVNEKSDDLDKNIDTLKSVKALCNIFEGKNPTKIDYVNAKGKLVKDASFKTLKAYVDDAKKLVKDINGLAGDEVLYTNLNTYATAVAGLETRYDAFVADAAIIGGDALVATVTNVDKLVEILDAVENLQDAEYAFGRYVDRASIAANMPTSGDAFLTVVDGEYVFAADLYKEAVAELDAWAEEYGLSEANKKAIYNAKKGTAIAYDDIAKYVRILELKTAAYDKFVADIAPAIVALNEGADKTSAAAVDYIAVQEMVKDILVILKADKSNDDLNKAILGSSKELALTADDLADFALAAEIYDEDAAATKAAALKAAATDVKNVKAYAIKLFSFVDDEDTTDVDEAAALEEYFTVTVAAINGEIDSLNNKIKALANKVANYDIVSVKDFMVLSGEYVTLDKLLSGKTFKAANGDVVAANAAYYVLVSDIDTDDFAADAIANDTIAAFVNGTYKTYGEITKDFAELINVDAFNTAWKTLEESVNARFDDAAAIVAAVDAIDYIRGGANAMLYTDLNNNGEYDADNEAEVETAVAPTYLVNLNAKAAVKAAKDKYDAWVLAGGRLNLQKLVEAKNANDKSYGNVYTFAELRNTEDSLEAAINLIGELNDDIKAINAMYNTLVKLIDGVVAADAYTKFEVTKNGESYINVFGNLPDRNDYAMKYYAITKFVATTDKEDVGIYDGTYSYVKTTGDITTKGYNGPQTEGGNGNAVITAFGNTVTTKKALTDAVVAAYNAYVAANLEVVADAANDYDDASAKVYYAIKGVAANDTVKTKLETYAKYDLLRAKGEIVNTFGLKTDNTSKNLVSQVVAATSFAQIVSAVKNYNDIADVDYDLADLNAVTIYNIK